MISERTEILKSFDGERIFFRCATPQKSASQKISGLVVAVHGFGEHSGRYEHVAEFVCNQGLAFASFDLRGHGHSGPQKGDAPNLQALVLDVIYVINHSLRFLGFAQADKDFFFGILGHSFGGLLVTYAGGILAKSCPPLFLSSPCYGLKKKLPLWKKWAGQVMPLVAPEIKIPLDISPSTLSYNTENNHAYTKDPLVLQEVSTRYGSLFLKSLDQNLILNAATQILAPVTLAYGAKDMLVDNTATIQISKSFPPRNNRIFAIDDAGHEIFNETSEIQKVVFEHFQHWIETKGQMQ